MKKVLAFIFCVFMYGCAIRSPQPPFLIEGPHAELEVRSSYFAGNSPSVFKANTEMSINTIVFDGSIGCPWGENQKFSESLLTNRMLSFHVPAQTIDIPIGGRIYISSRDSFGNVTCEQVVSFVPEEGGKYQLDITPYVNGFRGPCSATVRRQSGETYVDENTFRYHQLNNYFNLVISYSEVCD